MDEVFIEGLRVEAPIGVYEHEKGVLQPLIVDLSVRLHLDEAGNSDALDKALDYDQLAAAVREVCAARHHALIEAVAEEIAAAVFQRCAPAQEVGVTVKKPSAIPDAACAGVRIRRNRPVSWDQIMSQVQQ